MLTQNVKGFPENGVQLLLLFCICFFKIKSVKREAKFVKIKSVIGEQLLIQHKIDSSVL